MHRPARHALITFGIFACTSVLAQPTGLPKALKGTYVWAMKNESQTFVIEDIKVVGPDAATGKLTWYANYRTCGLRSAPIEMKVTETTISFEAATNCTSFTAELTKAGSTWKGSAAVKDGSTMALTAE